MNKIKFSALMMSAILTFGSYASAASFTDMPTDPATAAAIDNAVKNGLLSGYEDNTVRPDNNIRRSEMAVIITRACKVEKEGDISQFADVVNEPDWVRLAMAKAYEMGAFAGDGYNMKPNDNITFQECFTVLSQVFDLLPPYQFLSQMPDAIPENHLLSGRRLYDVSVINQFGDKNEIASWAIPYVAGVVAHGGWNGINGKITPTAYITRAQFATVMDNLIKNYIDEPGTYNETFTGKTMVRCDGVILKDTKIDGDIYIGDNISPNGITVENVTADRIVIRGCAEPIEDENGQLTYNPDKFGLTISGTFDAIRLIRPYINLNIADAIHNSKYTVPNTNIGINAVSVQ